MTVIAEFIVEGIPIAKARPRFARRTSKAGKAFVSTYTPAHSANYEAQIAAYARNSMRGLEPSLKALSLEIKFYMPIPESWSKKKKAMAISGELFPTTKPDLDNIVKSIKDGMNEIVFHDDSQVVQLIATKVYSEEPKAEIKVTLMGDKA